MMLRLAREPLVHFVALGALIFAGWYWFNPPKPPQDEIVIDQQEFDHLKTLWTAQWKREPSPQDVQAIIDRHVRKEVFYREGLRLNLDQNDEIIKRRIAQKMEAVAGDINRLMKPVTDDDLRAFMRDNPDLFRIPQAYAFEQILFLPSERQKAVSILASLSSGGAVPDGSEARLGVPNTWPETTVTDLANAFGDEFPAKLAELPVGEWSGPIESGYGLHLVRVDKRDASYLPDFETVKPYLQREYEYQAQLDAEEETFQSLLTRYKVRVTANDVPGEVQTASAAN